MAILRCQNISKNYRRFGQSCLALDDISFSIHEGECVGFLGKSGSGKSTLIRCLLGLEKPTGGEIFFEDRALSTFSRQDFYDYRQKVAWVSQDHLLLSSQTVFENVAFPLRLQNVEDGKIEKSVMDILDYLGLPDKRSFYPSQLSGGQQQRVSIGRALVKHPKVLFCDEPTSALDSETSLSIVSLLEKLQKDKHLTIALVTHHEVLADRLCDRVIRLAKGRAVENIGLALAPSFA